MSILIIARLPKSAFLLDHCRVVAQFCPPTAVTIIISLPDLCKHNTIELRQRLENR